MSAHASVGGERSDFGALYVVGAYLDASPAEAHHLLSALSLWPTDGTALALHRRQWALLDAMRTLRETLAVSWDELATRWVERSLEGLLSLETANLRANGDGVVPSLDSGSDLLPALAHWLDADPVELARLIDGHGRWLGLDDVVPVLDAAASTLRAVCRLWWLKTWLGVSVDEFLALESHL